MSEALPFRPAEQDGRLLVQFGIPGGGQEEGASTPVQLVHVPPWLLQLPVKAQELKLPMLLMVQWSPRSPTSTMSPLGALTVTEHGAVPCEMVPSSQWESETGPPAELLIVKSNVVTTQPPAGVRRR